MELITQIQERNAKVEADKAWETSLTRKVIIMFLTYLVVVVFLKLIGDSNPFVHGLVPVCGYFLSTLSLRAVKQLWLQFCYKRDKN
jgi:hypothetical protein